MLKNGTEHAEPLFIALTVTGNLKMVSCLTCALLTYPEFHFEIEITLIVSQACMISRQLCFKWMFTIFTRALPRELNSRGKNFQLEIRLRFFNRSYVKFMQFEIGPHDFQKLKLLRSGITI